MGAKVEMNKPIIFIEEISGCKTRLKAAKTAL
jgi:hypothetical protein